MYWKYISVWTSTPHGVLYSAGNSYFHLSHLNHLESDPRDAFESLSALPRLPGQSSRCAAAKEVPVGNLKSYINNGEVFMSFLPLFLPPPLSLSLSLQNTLLLPHLMQLALFCIVFIDAALALYPNPYGNPTGDILLCTDEAC